MLIQKRLSLNYGKHINQLCTGGDKLKLKSVLMSDASINMESPNQTSASTSGVSSACSGSLQQLSGGVTSDISDPNGSLTDKGEISMEGTFDLMTRITLVYNKFVKIKSACRFTDFYH